MNFNNTNLDNLSTKFKHNKQMIKYIVIALLGILIIGLIIFLSNNTTKDEYFLVLNGDTDIIIKQNSSYEDAGFKAYDNHGNDLTSEVVINGNVDPDVAGEYKITYTLNNISRERTVLVVANENQTTYLILSGATTIFLKVGEPYTEPGYTVIDNLEDNLTEKVTVSGNVDTTVAGTYKLKYSVTNKSGDTISEERTIIMMDLDINLNYSPSKITNQEVTINVTVSDNYFDYILLPDNTKVSTRTANYTVNKNGTYKFLIYSKDNSYKEQVIEINNIDKEKPTGSCSGYYKNGNSYITINAHDNKSIAKYLLNNQTYTSKQITYNRELTTANIDIYDKANNITTITCNLTNKNTVYPAYFGVKTYTDSSGNNMSYWLYVPKNARDNMPMIIFLHGSGEAGNDYRKGTTNAITWGPGNDIKNYDANFNAIILMPQTPENWWGEYNLKTVINLSNKIVDEYKIDKQRISLSGFSIGCQAISETLKLYPNYFSATVPIECYLDLSDTQAKYFLNTPTWAFASQDSSNQIAKAMANKITNLGGNAKATTYPYLGHTGLVGANNYSIFTDPELDLVTWMTSQKKN